MTRRKQAVGLHTDWLAESLWSCLHEDFNFGSVFGDAKLALQSKQVKAFRGALEREVGFTTPMRFKQLAQLQNLLKKYRFSHDVYTSDELEDLTNRKYIDNQIRIAGNRFTPVKQTSFLVLQRARTIAKGILGTVDPEEILRLAKFGKKSSIGCPLRLAYIDHKLTDKRAFTGTTECANWFFDNVLPKDRILDKLVQRIGIKPGHKQLALDHLVLENVPKTWKVHRGITPLPLITLFYTYGVGRAIQCRLKENGLDIQFLQDRHRHLIRRFSQTCRHVTADLSAASDSITSDLLNAVLPRPWYNLVRKSFTHQVKVGDRLCFTESVLPMGNGLTFPVETLVFYSLTKAIGELTGSGGTYSVFGDDLIYPRRIHRYVARIFPLLGIQLNMDKTFVSYPFRESCGEDFYRGVPVRSYYLRNEESTTLKGRRLESYLYKIINGLLRRWDEHEIPITLNFLLRLLSCSTFRVLRVPPQFPDSSGIKVADPNHHVLGNGFVPYEPVHIQFAHGSRWFRFRYLRLVAKKRFIKFQEPYYWQTLSGDDDRPDTRFLRKRRGIYYVESSKPNVQWQNQHVKRLVRAKGRRPQMKWVDELTPFVASRVIEQYKLQENGANTCSDWT